MSIERMMDSRSPFTSVVAGPVSSVTIPGLMTSEVASALGSFSRVITVPVNPSKDYDTGLHRAKSLSANFRHADESQRVFRLPLAAFQRRHEFRRYFQDQVKLAVALAWPGIDNSWIGEFVHVARQVGAQSVVLVVDHPSALQGAPSIAREVAGCDLVLVGDIMSATLLSAHLGTQRPVIEVHSALSLTGRSVGNSRKRLTTFLPKDDEQALLGVLRAFDAIPSDWIDEYDLRVIMRYSGRRVPDHVAASYHRDHVELIGEDFSSLDVRDIVSDSSAMSVADPALDSRVFAAAVDSGVATVVLAGDMVTDVGRGYVGGLLADVNRPTSIYVAHNHALRLSSLRFPSPESWFDLATRLCSAASPNGDRPLKAVAPRFS